VTPEQRREAVTPRGQERRLVEKAARKAVQAAGGEEVSGGAASFGHALKIQEEQAASAEEASGGQPGRSKQWQGRAGLR
jgi:hypothetical protein